MTKIVSFLLVLGSCLLTIRCDDGDPNETGHTDTDSGNEDRDDLRNETEDGNTGETSNNNTDSTDEHRDDVCNATSVQGLKACVDGKRYIADLESVTVLRPPGSEGWQDVQDFLAIRLEQLGYEVTRWDYGSGVNVIGRLPGIIEEETEVNLSAHYDHIPGCPGADDNASAVAGALEIARVLAGKKFERTLVVAFWDEEELGLIGSRHYAQRAKKRGDRISVALVLEMIGYIDTAPNTQEFPAGFGLLFPKQVEALEKNENRADFILFIADGSASLALTSLSNHAGLESLPAVSLRLSSTQKTSPLLSPLRRSDHASFWYANYPAIMIGDTANYRYDAYHCEKRMDEIALLNHDFSVKVIRTTLATLVEELGLDI